MSPLHIQLVDQVSISFQGSDLLWLCVIIPWLVKYVMSVCDHLIKSYNMHYVIPEIQAHSPDRSLARGLNGWSVTSLGRARAMS